MHRCSPREGPASADDDGAPHERMGRAVIVVSAGFVEGMPPNGGGLKGARVVTPVVSRYRVRQRVAIDPLDGGAGGYFDPGARKCELGDVDPHHAARVGRPPLDRSRGCPRTALRVT